MIREDRPHRPRPAHPSAFRIEQCLIVPELNRIERDGEVHQIEPRVMNVLVCLASRPGEVLSRETLFDLVWTDSVVCEEALTRTISELRRVLRDDTRTPRVIETIRKRGYRLIAPVTPIAPAAEPAPPSNGAVAAADSDTASPPQTTAQATRGGSRRAWRIGTWALAATAAILLGFWGVRMIARPTSSPRALPDPVPLTSSPGLELFPALSPNGAMVAFAWNGEGSSDASALDLYVMKVPDGSPARLTSLPGRECFPSWSPDGAEIAFSRDADDGSEICTIPVAGGEVRRLARSRGTITGLDWSPDDRWIAFSAADDPASTPRIHLLRLQDGSDRVLTVPIQGSQGDIAPAFSPDARAIAFIRINRRQEHDACWVPIAGGEVRTLDMAGRRVSGVDWVTPKALVVSASSRIDFGLWKVTRESDRRVRLGIPGGRIQRVTLARDGRRLAYEKISFAQSIWCADISSSGAVNRRPEPLVASTQRDAEPVISPDGRSIAFVSDRSGFPEIWITDASGAHPRRITEAKGTQLIRPRWSPDGTRIAFTSNLDGHLSICVTDVSSRTTRQILTGGRPALGVWSRDGESIFYEDDTASGAEVWRVRPDGSGRARLSAAGYHIVDEAPDGRGLLCVRSEDRGIWLLPFDGGPESQIVPADRCRSWQEIAVSDRGFYFTEHGRDTSMLGFYDAATGAADSLGALQWYAASLALGPDRRTLLYDSIGRIEIDLMLTEMTD